MNPNPPMYVANSTKTFRVFPQLNVVLEGSLFAGSCCHNYGPFYGIFSNPQ